MREQLESLNSVSINFGEFGITIVNIILAFVMFGVALGIKPRTMKEVFKRPKSVFIGVFLQWIALPAVTFAVALAILPLYRSATDYMAAQRQDICCAGLYY